jgi:hypothetical protein
MKMRKLIYLIHPRKVVVDRTAIALFNAQWPGSNLRTTRSYWFEFDRNRDLIDTDLPEHDDGSPAMALVEDCRAWLFDLHQPSWIP